MTEGRRFGSFLTCDSRDLRLGKQYRWDLAILYLGCVEHCYAPKNRNMSPKGAEGSLQAECWGRVVRGPGEKT